MRAYVDTLAIVFGKILADFHRAILDSMLAHLLGLDSAKVDSPPVYKPNWMTISRELLQGWEWSAQVSLQPAERGLRHL